jgi:diguanylate cyclase (GGDEF)-like protein
MRTLILKKGRPLTIVFITALSIAISVAITISAMLVFNQSNLFFGLCMSIAVPALVTPILTWHIIGLVLEINKLEESQRRLATYDELTGLRSRRAFLHESNNLINIAKRGNYYLALATIDIDNFKLINDRCGHAGGDTVLMSFASLLRDNLRESDIAGRIGGEEFAVTMLGGGVDAVDTVLERIRLVAENDQVAYLDEVINYKISIGVAALDGDFSSDLVQLMKRSDDALYVAKADGKNRVEKCKAKE